ncbi:MIP/aquaporin family protein [Pseudozobellia thermophila]|uniref:Glycerol uptake facilitator protein n=1 Tax=Pseudozobellia thermophila TaxID=192903 RepID=A0A1M6HXV7_9FLAO|nr:MIP/aquaporin family protein [Pseudozobellia thermophila]SHJ27056.1 glycerol uptake facilitator protein [Pseudozobellia thermophila]
MTVYIFEFIGTCLLILLGNGVVANLVLKDTKGSSTGWVGISLAWGIAVFVGVFVSADISGAHLNPAVTVGLATAGKFAWHLVPGYIVAQILGAMMGNLLVWLNYKKHYDATQDQAAILATFSTSPAIRSPFWNLATEVIGTFTLVFAVFYIAGGTVSDQPISLGSIDALPVALLVMGIGFGLGGPTGYAINPARDFGPRLMHALLPLKGKGGSDWSYAWIPIIGPFLGGFLAAITYLLIGI